MADEKINNLGIGYSLNHYRILKKIGAGGMGEVFLAVDSRLNRKVALKVLPENIAADKERLQRFKQEAFAASALNHPNILTIYEFGVEKDIHFLATEFIEGETLREKINGKELTLTEIINIAEQTAFALSAAHAAGIVHRDLKPENMMIRRDGIVKVLDFGLAKLIEKKEFSPDAETAAGSLLKTEPGVVMGTVPYMSPEQATAKDTDARTDAWSLGVVLYEMMSGKLPFAGETIYEVIVSILKSEPPLLSHYISGVPNDLDKIVGKCLRKNRDERYQNIKDLQIDLKDLRQDLELEAKLERSSAPNNRLDTIDKNREAQFTDATDAAILTKDVITHPTSSAEYVVREIKPHRGGLLAALLIVILIGVGFGYWFYANRLSLIDSKQINSIAILPFENGSGDANLDYLSDGLSESLIDNLSQLPQLKVIARSSSFKYRGANVDVQDAANKLGVQAIVMGRVVRAGDNLNVRVEMIDASENRQLWSEQYNRKASDLVAMQEGLSRDISEKLRARLTGAEQQQVIKRHTSNNEAYNLYLKGLYLANKQTPDALKEAVQLFEHAVTLDPNYALAYAELSQAYGRLGFYNFLDPKEALPKAKAAALKAIEIDGTLAEAHTSLAQIKLNTELNAADPALEKEFKRAIELNPNLANAHANYGTFLMLTGRIDEAFIETRRAQELDPLSLRINNALASVLVDARRTDEAIEQYKRMLEMDPDYTTARYNLALAYKYKGMHKEAIAEMQKVIEAEGTADSGTLAILGSMYAASGNRAEAEKLLVKIKSTKQYISQVDMSILYIDLGDKEQAIASLQKAYEERDIQLIQIKAVPDFDPLRSDPRFQDLLRRIGLTP